MVDRMVWNNDLFECVSVFIGLSPMVAQDEDDSSICLVCSDHDSLMWRV